MDEGIVDKTGILESVIDSIRGGVFQLLVRDDGALEFTYRSQRALELAHLPPDWSLGINAHPEDRDRLIASVHDAVRTLSPWSFNGRCLVSSGEVRWVEGSAVTTRTADAVVLNGLLLDITEKRQTEEILRQSEERLRALGDNLPESTVYQYMHDYDGIPRFLYISSGSERLNGVKAEDVLRDARTLLDQIPPEHYAAFREAEAASARDMSDFRIDIQMRRPDGEVRWMMLRSRPRRLPDGRVVWDGVQSDVTERKQAEEALRQSEERYRQIVETCQEGVWLIDADAATTYVNQRMADMLGYNREEMLGRSPLDFVDESQREKARSSLEQRKLGIPGQNEDLLPPEDGTELWAVIATSSLMDDGSKFVGALGMVADITKRKRAEEALRESEARFALAQSAADIGTWEHDLASGAIIWSGNLLDMFGVPPSAQPPQFEEWLQMIHPDDRQKVRDDLGRTLSDRVPLSTEYRFGCPSG